MLTFIEEPVAHKLGGSFFDHPLHGKGRAVGMGRFFKLPDGTRMEVDWAPMTVPDCMFRRHAVSFAHELGITEFVAPDPNSEAPTHSPEDMPLTLDLGDGILLRYGMAADACYPIKKHQAYLLRTGGCPALWVHYMGNPKEGVESRSGAGHGSLNSLLNNLPTHLVKDMQLTTEEMKRTFVSIVAPIHRWHFNHSTRDPVHGTKHRELCERIANEWGHRCVPSIDKDRTKEHAGQIDLGELATVQFERLGIPRRNISILASNVDDSPRHTDGSPRWYTTRNYPEYQPTPEMNKEIWRKRRNLIILSAA